jgi:hypothetical protein
MKLLGIKNFFQSKYEKLKTKPKLYSLFWFGFLYVSSLFVYGLFHTIVGLVMKTQY